MYAKKRHVSFKIWRNCQSTKSNNNGAQNTSYLIFLHTGHDAAHDIMIVQKRIACRATLFRNNCLAEFSTVDTLAVFYWLNSLRVILGHLLKDHKSISITNILAYHSIPIIRSSNIRYAIIECLGAIAHQSPSILANIYF